MNLEKKVDVPDYVVLSGDEINPEIIINFGYVKAKVFFLAPNGISAIITEPEKYQGTKTRSPHIPYFAMPYKDGWYSMNGRITKKGLNSIQGCVRKTFNELEIFHSNKQEIKTFYENIPERDASARLRKEYEEKKKSAKKLFKSKAIDNRQCQRELLKISPLQKEFQHAEYETMEKLSEFVHQKFGVFMHMDARDLLMKILED